MTTQPLPLSLSPLPHYPVLNPPEHSYINERYCTTLKLKRKSKNIGNVTSTIGCYPRNG